ncbi:MAG: BON domain-containing protein [Calditrichia bacterium]
MFKKNGMNLFVVWMMFMLFILGQIPVLANPPKDQATVDQAIKTLIENYISEKGLTPENKIDVTVANKTITLSGTVATLDVSNMLENYVRSIAESYSIDNQLKLAGSSISDAKIADAVMQKLYNYVFYTVYDWVTVDVKDGVVTLKGWSNLPWGPRYFAKQAEKVKGVKKVINDVQLAQGSDQIRERAARAIYTDPLFEWYAYQKNPPIHIIVQGDNVILEGVVDSQLESTHAYYDVLWNADAVNITNNLVIKKSAQ